jgi:hypothetical protein
MKMSKSVEVQQKASPNFAAKLTGTTLGVHTQPPYRHPSADLDSFDASIRQVAKGRCSEV